MLYTRLFASARVAVPRDAAALLEQEVLLAVGRHLAHRIPPTPKSLRDDKRHPIIKLIKRAFLKFEAPKYLPTRALRLLNYD